MTETQYYKNMLKLINESPQIIIERKPGAEVKKNLAAQLDEVHKRMTTEYYQEKLYQAQLKEVQEVARQAVLNAISEANINVELNGEKITEALIKQITTNYNGTNGGYKK